VAEKIVDEGPLNVVAKQGHAAELEDDAVASDVRSG
jgi:hypothetical protein